MIIRHLKTYLIACLFLFCFYLLPAQDSTNYIRQKSRQFVVKDSATKWQSFIFIGGGKGYCGKADGSAYAGNLSLVYKSHIFSLSGGGSFTSYSESPSKSNFLNYGYVGFLFGECIKFKRFFSSLSGGLAYTNLQYVETDLRTYAYLGGYLKSGLTIPIELKVAGLLTKNFGIGINVSKNFTLASRYAPLMVTVSLVFGKWDFLKKC